MFAIGLSNIASLAVTGQPQVQSCCVTQVFL
jgi:hypothetical protein